MSVEADWSKAFARQAQADWRAYECLLRSGAEFELAQTEDLHFLQMAVEKFVKAHLYWHRTMGNLEQLQSTHAVIAKHLPTIFRALYGRYQQGGRPSGIAMRMVRQISAELDYLHPNNDGGGSRPDNCEYPWKDVAGVIHVPSEHPFEQFKIARDKWWIDLVKIVKAEMGRLAIQS